MNLRKSLAKKLKKTGGFTLIEMLVVVAIIAILIAISIPMVSGALEKARVAADAANLQAAKSVALMAEMSGTLDGTSDGTAISAGTYFYDISEGELSSGTPASDDAPQSSALKTARHTAIVVTFDANKRITAGPAWGTKS